jgi:hypothetical protein
MDESYFARPYTDLHEWRDEPVRHRYVHGGFDGTETRFSCYFPPTEQYAGRFVHNIEGGGGGSDEAAWLPADPLGSDVANALAAGAYFVVSNQGHDGPDATHLERWIHHYGANVAVAQYSREVAESVYGAAPHHGYIYGGSGGAGRTIACLEHAPAGLYDGAVVYILPHVAQQVLGAFVAETARVLGDALPGIVDATGPGGSGDPFAGLTAEQRVTLATLYKLGFPRGAEDQIFPVTIALNGVVPGLRDLDPGYFDDFWTEPGYAGNSESVRASRVQRDYAVVRLLTAGEIVDDPVITEAMDPYQFLAVGGVARARPDAVIGVVLEGLSPREAVGANLTVRTGTAAGRELLSLGGGDGVIVAAGGRRNMSIGFEEVVIGDEVLVDNSDFLAYANFTRYQDEDYPELAAFRVDGRPVYPQRARATGSPELYLVAPYEGAFDQKMIVIQNTHDAQCWPCAAENLRRLLVARRGSDRDLRVWFTEHAMHLPTGPRVPEGPPPVRSTRLVDYRGHVHQAVRDMIAWVEDGTDPPGDTNYARSDDGAVILPLDADERQGIQPVVVATVNGGARAEVGVGEIVELDAAAAAPPGGGTIVTVEWDFDGTGAFALREAGIDGSRRDVQVTQKTTFDAPGVYFLCVRVTAHREGDVNSPQRRLTNLARVRVVVSG